MNGNGAGRHRVHLDVPTLMVAGAFVALMSGAILIFAWYQYRETRAALWWAGADFALACGIVLLAVGTDKAPIFSVGLALLCMASALSWAGARSFDGHPIKAFVLVLGTAVWVAAQALPVWLLTPVAHSVLNVLVTLAYYGATALTISRGKGEALRARLPLVVLLSVHALTLSIAVPASLTMELLPNEPPPVLSWFGIIHFETIVFAIGTAIFLIVMMKERNESRLVVSANMDALTGVPNRRGFFLKAERVLERSRHEQAPVAVAMFDLDRFKSVNDTFGHATGDRVLQTFVEVCATALRPGDLFGRVGGEEFAALMPGSGIEAGLAIAERVRKAMAEAGAVIDGVAINCTVSGGVASGIAAEDVHTLLREADAGLYKAKTLGRNRIECIAGPDGHDDQAKVIRVA